MSTLFSVRPKLKVALGLLMLIIILLCGVLLERSFISRVNEASNSIFNDRLVPSTSVYLLSDHITQRRLITVAYVRNYPEAAKNPQRLLSFHKQQIDSVLAKFEATYLVKSESKSLNSLKGHLNHYNQLETELLATRDSAKLKSAFKLYNQIREELMTLSQIQTNVGQDLLDETESIASNAGTVSHFQVIALIITCLIIQGFILASKAISSPTKQKYNLN